MNMAHLGVIAGLDPAIHAASRLARSCIRQTSAWTTGSSSVVTTEGERCRRFENQLTRVDDLKTRGDIVSD
jgi:hypothetical protein